MTCAIWQMRLFVENKHIQNVYTHWRRPGLHDTAELNSLEENNALPRHMNLRHFLIFPLVLRRRRHFLCKSCLAVKTVLILFRWQFPSSVRENVAFDCERPQRHKANGLFPFPFGSEHHSLNTISIMFRPFSGVNVKFSTRTMKDCFAQTRFALRRGNTILQNATW